MLEMTLMLICETVGGHRLGPWTHMETPDEPLLRFEHAQCRWLCRQWYVRPERLTPLPFEPTPGGDRA